MNILTPFVFAACTAALLLGVAEAAYMDCSPTYFTMPDCKKFLTYRNTIEKPRASCCTALDSILKAKAECLCVGFGNAAHQFGFDFARVLYILAACNLPAPNCGLPPPPKAAPPVSLPPKASPPAPAPKATPPAHAPEPASAPAPKSQDGSGPSPSQAVVAPASPPEKSGSAYISGIPLVVAAFGVFTASFIRL